jgi:hypothetical protein
MQDLWMTHNFWPGFFDFMKHSQNQPPFPWTRLHAMKWFWVLNFWRHKTKFRVRCSMSKIVRVYQWKMLKHRPVYIKGFCTLPSWIAYGCRVSVNPPSHQSRWPCKLFFETVRNKSSDLSSDVFSTIQETVRNESSDLSSDVFSTIQEFWKLSEQNYL